MNTFDKIVGRGLDACAFLLFGLSLAIPSGYSYGSVGLLLFAILGCKVLWQQKNKCPTLALVGLLLWMGLLWWLSFDGWWMWAKTDYGMKYALAALTLAVVAVWGVSRQAIQGGLALGALAALGVAFYQFKVVGWWNPALGYTNSIQFGGIAVFMGMACWCFALFGKQHSFVQALMWLAGAGGISAALLAGTRGAWVVVPLLLLVMLYLALRNGLGRWALAAGFVAVLLGGGAVLLNSENFEHRIALAVAEVQQYMHSPQQAAETSVGHRLEHWRVVMQMITEKPWTGWGAQGVMEGKKDLVAQGLAHPSVVELGHAHNEILDMWSKRGGVGLLSLLVFYMLPLCLFWPTKKRLMQVRDAFRADALSLRTAASLLPLAYFGYGWTQVFFAHNSGNMFYLFGLVVFWAGIQQIERKSDKS